MASAANRLAAAALLAVFVAAAAAQAAPKGWSTPTFHKFQSDARFGQLPGQLAASGKASVASAADGKAVSVANEADYYSYYGSDRYYKESKQTCLAETRQYNCAMYGCQNNVQASCDCDSPNCATTWFPNGGPQDDEVEDSVCYNCRIGNYYTSDFTCLKEEHYYYGYGNPTNFFQSQNTVASCDWTINWLRKDKSDTGNEIGAAGATDGGNCDTDNVLSDNCGWQTVYQDRTYKVGTATANCYFSAEADQCGEPLCNRMLVTLQGDVYVSWAYSHDLGAFGSNNTNDPIRSSCCFNWANIDNGDCAAYGIRPWSNNYPRVANGRNTADQRTTGRKLAEAEGGAKVEAANYGYDEYSHHHHDHTTVVTTPQTTYLGGAVIISGSVTSINGQKYEARYEDGQFEYVPYFYEVGASTDNGFSVDPNLPWVKPNSVKLEFWKDGDRYYSS